MGTGHLLLQICGFSDYKYPPLWDWGSSVSEHLHEALGLITDFVKNKIKFKSKIKKTPHKWENKN
jgi:hypothetical protein